MERKEGNWSVEGLTGCDFSGEWGLLSGLTGKEREGFKEGRGAAAAKLNVAAAAPKILRKI